MEVPRSIYNPGPVRDDEISRNLEDVRPKVEPRFLSMAAGYMHKLGRLETGLTSSVGDEGSGGGETGRYDTMPSSTQTPDPYRLGFETRAKGDQAVTPAVHKSGRTPLDQRKDAEVIPLFEREVINKTR